MHEDEDKLGRQKVDLSQALNGHFYANREVLDALKEHSEKLPGVWSYLTGLVFYGAIFWLAFENWAATIGLVTIVMAIIGLDRARRKDVIDAKYRAELQNGIMRGIYAQQQRTHQILVELRDYQRQSERRRAQAEKKQEFEDALIDLRELGDQ